LTVVGADTPKENAQIDTALDRGHWLFAQPCTFVKGVVKLEGLPDDALPEIAFAGRSNVGKSSLVNAMTGRKTLARTSNTPGRTQEINYFTLGQPDREGLFLVDLPGYGYARESKDRIATWTDLVMTYLQGRATLRRVLLLIDARHGIKKNDEEVMAMLDKAAVSYLIVLTKADKLKKGEIEKRLETTKVQLRKHVAAFPEIAVTSSEKGTGIPELRAHIAELAELEPMGYKAGT
jgi:GTP-binding protein